VNKSGLPAVFAVARGGVAWSAVSFANRHAGWMVGGQGRIVKISF
jgi:hypothetical protein